MAAAFRGISRLLGGRGDAAVGTPSSSISLHLGCKVTSLPTLLVPTRGIVSKLFVGGLSYYTTEKTLNDAFTQYGQVIEAKIISERDSDRSKGFGFVTYASEDEALTAIEGMDGQELNGRTIFVEFAKANQGSSRGHFIVARGPPQGTTGSAEKRERTAIGKQGSIEPTDGHR